MAIKRREFLIGGLGAVAAAPVSLPAVAQGQAPAPVLPSSFNDGLAHPIPYAPKLGTGKKRALVLGGGGAYLAAWMVGYFVALKKNGVDLANADICVGTSAGAVLGASLLGGKLWRLSAEMDILAEFPKLFAEILPAVAPNESQIRAHQIAVAATKADAATIRAIGVAAMAARNPAGPEAYFKTMERIIGESAWPAPHFYTTANDCYTGERLVVSANDGIPANMACAASSSLPGGMGPTWLKNRLCMDGGICRTSTHCDVVAGAERALVISLTDGSANAAKLGLRTSSMPNILQQEVRDLQKGGTQTVLKVVGLLPGIKSVDSIVDPKWIAPCLKWGHERGLADAADMRAFWM